MPTRSEFLTTGLVPILLSDQPTDDVCSICTCDFSDPVKTPCGHIYDVECITKWLNMKGRNTCAMCKTELFDLPEDEDVGGGNDRQALVVAAIRASRISERDGLDRIESYGTDTSIVTVSSFRRATAHAAGYLAQARRGMPAYVSGPALIRNDSIAPAFLAMGNLVPALAGAQGRAYNTQQSMDWQLVLTTLWQLVQSQNGKRVDALIMPAKLRQDLKTQLRSRFSDVENIEFFSSYPDAEPASNLFNDLDILLNYLTLCSWTLQREEEAVATKKAETEAARRQARKGTKAKSSCCIM